MRCPAWLAALPRPALPSEPASPPASQPAGLPAALRGALLRGAALHSLAQPTAPLARTPPRSCTPFPLPLPFPVPLSLSRSTALLGDNDGQLAVVDARAPGGAGLRPALPLHAKKINTAHFEPTQEQVQSGRAGGARWVSTRLPHGPILRPPAPASFSHPHSAGVCHRLHRHHGPAVGPARARRQPRRPRAAAAGHRAARQGQPGRLLRPRWCACGLLGRCWGAARGPLPKPHHAGRLLASPARALACAAAAWPAPCPRCSRALQRAFRTRAQAHAAWSPPASTTPCGRGTAPPAWRRCCASSTTTTRVGCAARCAAPLCCARCCLERCAGWGAEL